MKAKVKEVILPKNQSGITHFHLSGFLPKEANISLPNKVEKLTGVHHITMQDEVHMGNGWTEFCLEERYRNEIDIETIKNVIERVVNEWLLNCK